jgi:hypothetical protein
MPTAGRVRLGRKQLSPHEHGGSGIHVLARSIARGAHGAGESDNGLLPVDCDRRLMLEFHASTITSDSGLLVYQELNNALCLTDPAGGVLSDGRCGREAHAECSL